MKAYFLILLCIILVLLNACISDSLKKSSSDAPPGISKEESNIVSRQLVEIEWSAIPIQSLPYSLLPEELGGRAVNKSDFEKFFEQWNLSFNKYKKLDKLFSNQTEFNHKPYEYFGEPSNASGHFFCRLTDFETYRILLFAVYEENDDFNINVGTRSIWIEAQVFDPNNVLTDKMIVYIAVVNECSFYRGVTFESGLIILEDRIHCIDIYDDTTISDESKTYVYKISEKGKFIEEHRFRKRK